MVGPGRALETSLLNCGTCLGSTASNGTGLWRCYTVPDNMTNSIDNQGRMLALVRDQRSDVAKHLSGPYAEAGAAGGDLCRTAQLLFTSFPIIKSSALNMKSKGKTNDR